jgi:protein-S-isoprenylcysteine O-methyltransferase Ste14
MLVSYLGIALLFNSVIGASALVVMVIPAMIFRIAKEETLLAARLSEGWKKYQNQTPARLIPHVW